MLIPIFRPDGGSRRAIDGQAAEEVERLITVPVEVEMNGIPRDDRNPVDLALYGLSDVIMSFRNDTDDYFNANRFTKG